MEENKVVDAPVKKDDTAVNAPVKKKKKPSEKVKKNSGKKSSKKGFLGFVLRHKVLCIIVVIVIVVIISGQISRKKAEPFDFEPVNDTATIERTDVTNTVSGTGKIVAAEVKEIIVDDMAGQKIQTMNVQIGDYVKAGDVLCVFDTEELNLDLADAEAELNRINIQSNNSVATTKRNTTDTEIDKVTQTYRDIESVDEAQRILDTKKGELAEAQRIYDKEYEIFRELYNEDVYYDLLKKEANNAISADEVKLLASVRSAKSTLDSIKSTVDAAQSQVNTASDNLQRAQETYTDNVRHGITSIENAHDNLEDSYASNSTARLNTQKTIRGYEAKLNVTEVIAPIDGIITNIAVEEGNKYSSGALFKIEDAAAYIVEVNVDEYDISDVAVGQKVTIKTNATGDEELEGVVSKIAPKASSAATTTSSTSSGSSTPSYKVTIDVITKNDRLRMDMTAKIVITTNESIDTLAVPSEAIKTDADGKTYINVSEVSPADMADVLDLDADSRSGFGKNRKDSKDTQDSNMEVPKKKVYVKVGIESSYFSEISGDGIKEGMTVYLNDDTDTDDTEQSDILGGI